MADPQLARVKVHPDIGLAALRDHTDREARLWHVAHALDRDGRGWWAVTELTDALDPLGVDGLSPSTVRRLLQAGDGVYWQLIGDGPDRDVRLYGLEAVARALDLERLSQPVWIPLEHVQRLQSWRGAILGAFHAARAGSATWTAPISRQRLEGLTGYGARTQRRWEKTLGGDFKSRPNAYIRKDQVEDLPTTKDELEELNEQGYFLEKIGNRTVMLAFSPSSFWCAFQLAPRGQTKKVNRVLRPVSYERATWPTRLFFSDPKGLVNRIHELDEGERAFGYGANVNDQDVTTSRGGWHLWTRYSMEGAQLCYR